MWSLFQNILLYVIFRTEVDHSWSWVKETEESETADGEGGAGVCIISLALEVQ